MVKPGQKRQKWEQEQNTMKTTRSKKMMAARTNIDVTSFHFLLSIARPFEKRFREVFGNARILNFYLSIRAWEEKSLPESYLGCFYIVFGEGKATKENMSIFWFIWPLRSLVCLAWVVCIDHFITKSCYYQTKIFAGLLICVLATSLLVFQGQWIIFFSHTYSSLHSSISKR